MCVRVDSVPTETPITVPGRPAGCTEEQPFDEVPPWTKQQHGDPPSPATAAFSAAAPGQQDSCADASQMPRHAAGWEDWPLLEAILRGTTSGAGRLAQQR